MKKLLAILFVLALAVTVLAVPAMAADGTVTVEVTTTASGDVVKGSGASYDVTITVHNNGAAIGAITVIATVPDGFDVKNFQAHAAPSGGSTVSNPARYSVDYYWETDLVGNKDASWPIITMTLVENGTAKLGSKSITPSLGMCIDPDGSEIDCSAPEKALNLVHAGEHTWGTGVVTKPNDCVTDGLMTYHCTQEGCPGTKTEVIAKTGHKAAEEWKSDGQTHWHECSVCHDPAVKLDEASHDGKIITDNKDNKTHTVECSICHHQDKEVAHKVGDWQKDENSHYKVCSDCGAHVDEAEHAVDDPQKWDSDDTNHYHVCKTCGQIFDVHQHVAGAEKDVEKEPTCTEPGLGSYTCTVCGKKLESAPIPAEGHQKPETGVEHVAATCEKGGYDKYQCVRCEENIEEPTEGEPALGHEFDTTKEETEIKEEYKPTSYLAPGKKVYKCVRYGQGGCEATKDEVIPQLTLDSDHLTVTPIVRGLDESVGAGVKAQIENFVKDYAKTGKHGPEVSDEFADAVMAALEGSEPIEIEVTVALDDVAANKLPASFNDAPGALLDSKQLTITAKVNGTAVDGDILSALPAPAAFSINKKYPNLIGLMNYGDEKGYSGLEFTKDGDVTTASALEVGYYALYTTSDLRWAEIFFDQTNVFNGSAVEPKVRIVVNGKELDPSYYTITYKNNDKVGTGEFSIELTAEGEAAGFTLAGPIVNDFEITAAPATPTPKPAEKDKSQSDVPATGDETNVVLYAAVMVLCTAALALVLLRKKSSR